MSRPPCWPDGQPCPNPCAQRRYDRLVHNRVTLTAEWAGWRLAGRCLVSPDGDRIAPERLRGILFAEASRQRLAKLRQAHRAVVVTLPARERFAGSA